MSEQNSGQEKTEPASQKRRQQAREKGEVAKSREIAGAATFLVMAGALAFGARHAVVCVAQMMRDGFLSIGDVENVGGKGLALLGQSISAVLPLLLAVFGLLAFVAIASNIGQFGLLWSMEPLKPKFNKLNPFPKLKKIFFSKNTVVELLKTLLKVGVLGFIGWQVVAGFLPTIVHLPMRDVGQAGSALGDILLALYAAVGAGTVAIAALDFAWQKRQHEEQLKMTKEEVKRERMEQDGNPVFKGARRQKHREMSLNRALSEVPKADVIVTNPTHFAVAIRYRAEEGRAPVVIAKGQDNIALAMRREARRRGIPVVEQKPLARALYRHVKVGRPVPQRLYQAVAEVLAYIYKINERRTVRRVGRQVSMRA